MEDISWININIKIYQKQGNWVTITISIAVISFERMKKNNKNETIIISGKFESVYSKWVFWVE